MRRFREQQRDLTRHFAGRGAVFQEAMNRGSRRTKDAVHKQFIPKAEMQGAFANERRLDIYEFSVMRGALVLHFQFQHRAHESGGFDVCVVRTRGAEIFQSRLLEPNRVYGMMDDAHLIRFGIANFNAASMNVLTDFHAAQYRKLLS